MPPVLERYTMEANVAEKMDGKKNRKGIREHSQGSHHKEAKLYTDKLCSVFPLLNPCNITELQFEGWTVSIVSKGTKNIPERDNNIEENTWML